MPEHALWATCRLEQLLQKDSFANGASFHLAKMARWLLAKKIKLILFFLLDSHYSMLLIEHLLLKYFLPSIYPTPVLPLNRFSINHGNRFSIRNGQTSQAHFHIFIWLVNVFLSQMIFLIGFQLNKSICSLEKCFNVTEATNQS